MKISVFCSLLKATAVDWWNDNTFRLSAALAFYTIFSLAPVTIIAIGVAGIFFGQERATREIVSEMESMIGPQAGAAVGQISTALPDRESGIRAIVVGVITVVVGSTIVFVELQGALNQIWDVQVRPERRRLRGLLRDRVQSFALALVVGVLLLASLILSAVMSGAAQYLDRVAPDVPWNWQIAHTVASYLLVFLLFGIIYKYLPDVRITWGDVAIGSAVTALLFTLGKQAISVYLGRLAVASTYGAAGSFVLFLLWVYYSAMICFFGAEFTQVYARRYGSGLHPRSYAMRKGEKSDRV